ncbi:hypothetical protein M413DRAFT_281224 [Hebeloma cylindrosporum]|uniref:Uncharacterized protein n=1 Tax=Hebeloma cylindrosporum TaxID=76867 RepID=A0A0C3BYE6_HEBCY|nr:hypothetical protein M413DRAFT_281224 [Hebeloma cylindrosporum h7]
MVGLDDRDATVKVVLAGILHGFGDLIPPYHSRFPLLAFRPDTVARLLIRFVPVYLTLFSFQRTDNLALGLAKRSCLYHIILAPYREKQVLSENVHESADPPLFFFIVIAGISWSSMPDYSDGRAGTYSIPIQLPVSFFLLTPSFLSLTISSFKATKFAFFLHETWTAHATVLLESSYRSFCISFRESHPVPCGSSIPSGIYNHNKTCCQE